MESMSAVLLDGTPDGIPIVANIHNGNIFINVTPNDIPIVLENGVTKAVLVKSGVNDSEENLKLLEESYPEAIIIDSTEMMQDFSWIVFA